jgi:acyl-coenzyme A synthetase/AMP-(fatty) acid ligase
MSTTIAEAVLRLIPEERDHELAKQILQDLLRNGNRVRVMAEAEALATEEQFQANQKHLLEERDAWYRQLSPEDGLFSKLKQISKQLRTPSPPKSEQICQLLAQIDNDLKSLQKIIGNKNKLPWQLRYVADFDHESEGCISLGGGPILDAQGRNVWSDYCATCDIEITETQYRCFSCVEQGVQCTECHNIWDLHVACNPGVIVEHVHPTFARLDIRAASGSLAATLTNLFHIWSNRPCFQSYNEQWLTYGQVYDRVSRIATRLKASGATEIMLCFPSGSMDFYLADLACVLAGITTVGCPVSPPPSPLPSIPFVICERQLLSEIKFPESTMFLNFTDDDLSTCTPFKVLLDQQDTLDSLYTLYYTSGSTGTPKEIPITRKSFLDDFSISAECIPGCYLSYLPPFWATDRATVYLCLYNGYRVSFSRRQATLQEIVEDIGHVEPTMLVALPTLLEFMSTMNPSPFLGNRLRNVVCGGAPVGSTIKQFVQETYGVVFEESYGTTECGGIASDGIILPHIVGMLRIKDPSSGAWLSPQRQEAVIGELWVGNKNAMDLVELTKNGTAIRVLGRSDMAVSFKLKNGEWCSLLDIECKILQSCAPDLVQQVLVLRNSRNILVLVAVVTKKTEEWVLLNQIRERVTLSTELFPQAVIVTMDPFPETQTHKVKRDCVVKKFADTAEQVHPSKELDSTGLDMGGLAARILGHAVNTDRSFLENGGDSISAVCWLKQVRLHFKENQREWQSLLNEPISGHFRSALSAASYASPAFSPIKADLSARHILLTGATGFLGQQVLKELLNQDIDTIIICLVREQSRKKLDTCERVAVVTEIPQDITYRQVVHLAAKVDHVLGFDALKDVNVDWTLKLLHLKLAPMLYCSTSSTQEGKPPFPDGYTQSKWICEKYVIESGGICVWPPFLLWGNQTSWLMRLITHCVATCVYPTQLGYLPCAPVEICAVELVAGGPCSAWDLDLDELFLLLRLQLHMRPVSLSNFITQAERDPLCAVYPIIPHLKGSQFGRQRSPHLDLYSLKGNDIKTILSALTASKTIS